MRSFGQVFEVVGLRHIVHFEDCRLAISFGEAIALLNQMVGQAVDATLGELLAAVFTGMGIAIARVIKLSTSQKVLEDQCWSLSAKFCKVTRCGMMQQSRRDRDF